MKRIYLSFIIFIFSTQFAYSTDLMTVSVLNTNISVFPGWLVSYTKSPNVYIVYSPLEKNDNFRENYNLTIESLTQQYSVKKYIDNTIAQISKIYGHFKLIERKDNYTIFSGVFSNMDLQQVQFVVIKNNIAYVLTFSSLRSDFSRYKKTFFEISKTFVVN